MSNSLVVPEVDLAKWGDRIINDPLNGALPMTGAAFRALVDSLPLSDKPVGVELDAQTLGRLYADRCTPYDFAQFLMDQLRASGCSAVEGVAGFKLRLNRGKIFKIKSVPQEFSFHYLWLADPLCTALGISGDDKNSLRMD